MRSPASRVAPSTYLPKPIRLLDTRVGATDAFACPQTPCKPGTPTTVQVAGVSYNSVTVPTGLAGAIGNLTVINELGEGFIEVVPSGAGDSGVSNADYLPASFVFNSFNVGLSISGALDIIVVGHGCDVIIDLFAVVA